MMGLCDFGHIGLIFVKDLLFLYLEHELLRPPTSLAMLRLKTTTCRLDSSHFLSFLLFIPLGHTPALVQITDKSLLCSDMS
jgi:hypothetical protein